MSIKKGNILALDIMPQPNDTTCGPTCLHAVYRYYDDHIELQQVIDEVAQLSTGGTLAVLLGNHALLRGYKAEIYTYNLHTFDLTWFHEGVSLEDKLKRQLIAKPHDLRLRVATHAYLEFLKNGGEIKSEEMTPKLMKKYLETGRPILTGLSATYLYESPRETGELVMQYDDILGEPTGHFVVIHGYGRNKNKNRMYVADPLLTNPISDIPYYSVNCRKLISAIMLGVMTYDANILVIYK